MPRHRRCTGHYATIRPSVCPMPLAQKRSFLGIYYRTHTLEAAISVPPPYDHRSGPNALTLKKSRRQYVHSEDRYYTMIL